MPTTLIHLGENSHAFVTKASDNNCRFGGEHYWDGPGVITYKHESCSGLEQEMTQTEYNKLSDEEKDRMRLTGGSANCSKCGMAYWHAHNPYFL